MRLAAIVALLCGLAAPKPVRYEQLNLPAGCDAGRERRVPLPLGPAQADRSPVPVASSARELSQLVGCAFDPSPDFQRVRVAVFRYTRSSAETYRVAGVSGDGSKIHLLFSVSRVCQGMAPQRFTGLALVAIPKQPKPVVADVEHQRQPPCGAVP